MSNDAKNPIAVITGGSRGIGRSTALKLAERGIDVIVTYRKDEAAAAEVVQRIQATGRRGAALKLDLGNSAGLAGFAGALDDVLRSWGRERFDFLVNNAGGGGYGLFVDTTEQQLDELWTVHFKSVFLLSQRLLPLIADGGRIVNVSTGIARYTYPGFSAYAAAKGAVEVLTRYMAQELGPRRISVNVVAPGGIDTDFGGGALRDPELQKAVAAETPLGRMGVPDDISGVIAPLLSPESGWINGQHVEVAGGYRL